MIWHNLRYPLFCPGAPSNVAGLGLGTLFCNRHNVCYRTIALSTDLLSRRHRSALSCCASSFSLNLNLFYGNFSSRKQWTQWISVIFVTAQCDVTYSGGSSRNSHVCVRAVPAIIACSCFDRHASPVPVAQSLGCDGSRLGVSSFRG